MSRGPWHSQFKRAPKDARTYNGMVFDSLSELSQWRDLENLQRAGHIKELKRQVAHDLILPNGVAVKTPTGRTAVYRADYEYFELMGNGEWRHVICDHKGFYDPHSQFRIAVFEAIYGVKVRITGERR